MFFVTYLRRELSCRPRQAFMPSQTVMLFAHSAVAANAGLLALQ